MAPDAEGLVAVLSPRVRGDARALPGPDLEVRIGLDAERGDDVLLKGFVLVIAPDQDEIGLEFVERLARPPESAGHLGAMGQGGGETLVVAPLAAEWFGPSRRVAEPLRQPGIGQGLAEGPAHVFGRSEHR